MTTKKKRRIMKPKARPEPKSQKEFAALQKEWYDYLKHKGFEDIEWVDHRTGYGQNSDNLKSPSSYVAKQYDPAVEEYYRKCRIYLEHGEFESKLLRYVFQLHTEGLSYRKIAKEVRKRKQWFGRTISIFWISQHLNELLDYIEYWHYMNPMGVNYPDTDFFIEDIPIKPLPESDE